MVNVLVGKIYNFTVKCITMESCMEYADMSNDMWVRDCFWIDNVIVTTISMKKISKIRWGQMHHLIYETDEHGIVLLRAYESSLEFVINWSNRPKILHPFTSSNFQWDNFSILTGIGIKKSLFLIYLHFLISLNYYCFRSFLNVV